MRTCSGCLVRILVICTLLISSTCRRRDAPVSNWPVISCLAACNRHFPVIPNGGILCRLLAVNAGSSRIADCRCRELFSTCLSDGHHRNDPYRCRCKEPRKSSGAVDSGGDEACLSRTACRIAARRRTENQKEIQQERHLACGFKRKTEYILLSRFAQPSEASRLRLPTDIVESAILQAIQPLIKRLRVEVTNTVFGSRCRCPHEAASQTGSYRRDARMLNNTQGRPIFGPDRQTVNGDHDQLPALGNAGGAKSRKTRGTAFSFSQNGEDVWLVAQNSVIQLFEHATNKRHETFRRLLREFSTREGAPGDVAVITNCGTVSVCIRADNKGGTLSMILRPATRVHDIFFGTILRQSAALRIGIYPLMDDADGVTASAAQRLFVPRVAGSALAEVYEAYIQRIAEEVDLMFRQSFSCLLPGTERFEQDARSLTRKAAVVFLTKVREATPECLGAVWQGITDRAAAHLNENLRWHVDRRRCHGTTLSQHRAESKRDKTRQKRKDLIGKLLVRLGLILVKFVIHREKVMRHRRNLLNEERQRTPRWTMLL
eukprot:GHVQ01037090.1.p1 GENE.GHVQ01037090.1~~GHVQ01037090.1.p1  ORF type:complete len:546 (+),score=35.01 GHVQ01037090.1:489-2126(+)